MVVVLKNKIVRKCVILLFLLIPIIVNAQYDKASSNQTDDLGRKQGKWKTYDEMGHIRYEGQFKDDIPFGNFKYFYPEGKLKAESYIYNQGRESRTKAYHHNGILMAEGKYFDRKKDSIWHYYSQYDGILLSEEIYVNTLRQGVWKTFYPEQKIAEELTHVDDQLQGPWLQYYTDGTIKMKGQYENGVKTGLFILNHPNGKLEAKGMYANSLKEGLWEQFDEEGNITKEEIYRRGKLIEEK